MITGEGRTGLLLAEVHRRRKSNPMPTRNHMFPSLDGLGAGGGRRE